MAKTTVRVRLDILRDLKKLTNEGLAKDVSDTVISGIMDHTSVGLSPVRGFGRFVGYKAQEQAKQLKTIAKNFNRANKKAQASSARAAAKSSSKGYPSSVQSRFPGKKIRPVNLSLSGSMLEALSYVFNSASNKITIGIFRGIDKLKAETHNEGTQSPDVPTRQFLPTRQGQEFTISIMRRIKEVYTKRLNSIIELSNK